ncbi:EAL domain-containing protein (plasmid) [Lichenicola cladoniae]|uniref:EAL domain-containing protein n=1 Tax=Lichenicola cladoniae TaxID=1484109 RepID=A0A6M8I0A6_9PROT|nr:EAL domain-containing protein [Acetobacteraceae bacterium]QKE93938.1 EAL domain-containing protein [Lichenicola cladoniae]
MPTTKALNVPNESGPAVGLGLSQIVRSAAHAAECPVAVLCQATASGTYQVITSFGVEDLRTHRVLETILGQAAVLFKDAILILNDTTTRCGLDGLPVATLSTGASLARFLAAFLVPSRDNALPHVLVVANVAPHAGLSAAKIYVLRTHAAQIASLLEMRLLRESLDAADLLVGSQSNNERLRMLESVVINANDAVLITEAEPIDLPGPRIVYCNKAFTRTTGYSETEILGRTPRLLQSPGTNRTTLDKLRGALSRWEPIEVELLNMHKDGTEFWVELSIVPVANEKGWFTHWVSVQRDVSDRKTAEETATRARVAEAENLILEAEIIERKRVEAQLFYAAFHDDLTKLRNRAFLMDRLTIALARTKIEPKFRCAVLFMDLDRFKLVNDSLGHRAGDLLLMEVAERLRSCIRPQDTLARLGGDEFALLIEGTDEPTFVITLTERIIKTMRRPLWVGKQEVFSSCSIGVVYATTRYDYPEEVLRDADIAMYQAKRHDIGGYAMFTATMHESLVSALELRTDLQNAVARNEFYLVYQTIHDTATGKITGVEALIRWKHPKRGIVTPVAFIGTAEEMGLIRSIGRWVLQEACTQMRTWRDRLPGLDLRLSVNTSAEELKDPQFTIELQDILTKTGLDPHTLQIEVTESIFLENPEIVGKTLSSIRALGVRIALDDFGTGYSSLSYLDRYAMDTIKIDRLFVTRMSTEPRTMAIIGTIVALGRVLDLEIVAEGIEDSTQLKALLDVGCGSVQGYLLSHPLDANDMEEFIAQQL